MLIIGGTFDKNGGKTSHFVSLIAKFFNCAVINGGNLKTIYEFRPHNTDILIWMPNIDNAEDKILERLKVMNPKMLLISSKRVIERQYTNFELVNRAIKAKANLTIVIRKSRGDYNFSIIDPLGNIYCENSIFSYMLLFLNKRIKELKQTKRIGSQQVEINHTPYVCKIDSEFINTVQKFGKQFSSIIQANNPDRFLGNASTRCEWGFPSQRTDTPTHAFVSKRNINKENIIENNFVKTCLTNNKVRYYGSQKPSVDTPVQLKLYEYLPNINYMIHGHCYIDGAPITENKVPCGDMREVREIMDILQTDKYLNFYAINLLGHGCIIMSNNVKSMNNVSLKPRPMFEP